MAGTVWPTLIASTRAKASEVEAKFDWLEQDIVPMSGGTKADASYDIGQTAFRFRDGLFSRIVTAGAGSVSNASFQKSGTAGDGIYFPASAIIGVTCGGVEKARFRATGALLTASGTDDVFLNYINGTTTATWSHGIDTSDGNVWKLSASNTPGTTDLVQAQPTGEILYPLQPAFMATMTAFSVSSGPANTTLTSLFTEVYDRNNDFSGGVFTAPKSGIYNLGVFLTFTQGGAVSQHNDQIGIETTGRSFFAQANVIVNTSAAANNTISFSQDFSMSAGETANIRVVFATTTIINAGNFYGSLKG